MEPLSPAAQARLEAFRRAEGPDDAAVERCLAAVEQEIEARAAPSRRRGPIALAALVVALAAGIVLAFQVGVIPSWQDRNAASAAPHELRAGDPDAAVDGERPVARGASAGDAVDSSNAVDSAASDRLGSEPSAALDGSAVDGADSAFEASAAGLSAGPEVDPATGPSAGLEANAARDLNAAEVGARDGDRADSKVGRPRVRADDLAAEVAMLREAKLATPAARLEILEAMARRFPAGALGSERRLLEIEARCALGEVEAARALTRRITDPDLAARAAELCPEAPSP